MNDVHKERWEQRYRADEAYLYGVDPNDFLAASVLEGPGHTGDGAVVQVVATRAT